MCPVGSGLQVASLVELAVDLRRVGERGGRAAHVAFELSHGERAGLRSWDWEEESRGSPGRARSLVKLEHEVGRGRVKAEGRAEPPRAL